MYETGSAVRDLLLAGLALVIVTCAVVALIPWGRRRALTRFMTHLPLAAVPAYGAYEWLMPNRFDIRIDLLVLWPALGACVLFWLLKVVLGRRRKG